MSSDRAIVNQLATKSCRTKTPLGVELVPFTDLVIDDAVNARTKGTIAAIVAEYAEERKAGKEFPPGRAFKGKDGIVLSRGFHRAKAYKGAGDTHFPVEILVGDRTAAMIDALGDNITHGLKRTNEDKRNAVERCLDLCPEWTQEKVAEHCGVSLNFVSDVLSERAAEFSSDENSMPADAQTEPDAAQAAEFSSDENSTPKPKASKRGRAGEGRPSSKAEAAKRVGVSLKIDSSRSDEVIAQATNTKPAFVAKIRKSLEKKGIIERKAKLPELDTKKEQPTPAPAKIVPPPVTDAWGIPVQPHAAEAFTAVPKFKELIALLHKVRSELTALCEHPGGRHLLRRCQFEKASNKAGGRWVMADLDNAIRLLESTTPKHTDCPYQFNAEQPHFKEGGRPCPLCDNLRFTGTLKQFQVPPEMLSKMKEHYGVSEKEAV